MAMRRGQCLFHSVSGPLNERNHVLLISARLAVGCLEVRLLGALKVVNGLRALEHSAEAVYLARVCYDRFASLIAEQPKGKLYQMVEAFAWNRGPSSSWVSLYVEL